MDNLKQAAKAVVDRWDSPKWEWSQQGPTADLMADLRTALAQEHAMHELARLGQEIEQEPVACVGPWHDARLTLIPRYSHQTFERDQPLYANPPAAQPEPPPEWEAINNIITEYGLDAIAFVSEWKAAQRQWQGLTDEILDDIYYCVEGGVNALETWRQQARAIEAAIKTWNTRAAQRPWQGLTPEDLAQIDTDEFWQVGNHMAIAMAVEAKLKERNNG